MAEHDRTFVDGEWIEAADGGTFAVSDPATGEVIASVADGGPAEATRAVEAAHRAFPAWAAMPPRERAPILHRIQALMETHREDLAVQVTRENGKPLEEARREVTFALGYFGSRTVTSTPPPCSSARVTSCASVSRRSSVRWRRS